MTDIPAAMNAGQEILIGVAGLCLCVGAPLASLRDIALGMRTASANPGAILPVTGFVFMYR